jgi:hypothetical protein
MTSLPLRVPERLREIPDIVGTYDICLGIEKALQLAIDKGDDVGNNQIYIRILGYLIHYVPTDQGLRNIVEEISSCVDDSAILDVGKKYYDHYIWACTFMFQIYSSTCNLTRAPVRANKGRIWTPFSDETPVSFDTITEMTTHTFVEAPQSHDGAKKNVGLILAFHEKLLMNTNQALIRDGYRCVVTKKYDSSLVGKVRELQDLFVSEGPDSPSADRTQCTHIFSESTNLNVPPSSETVCPPFKKISLVCLTNNTCLCIAGLCCLDVVCHEMFWV